MYELIKGNAVQKNKDLAFYKMEFRKEVNNIDYERGYRINFNDNTSIIVGLNYLHPRMIKYDGVPIDQLIHHGDSIIKRANEFLLTVKNEKGEVIYLYL